MKKEIEVAKEDFAVDLDWKQAISTCKKMGDGWRLPTREELEQIYNSLPRDAQGKLKLTGTNFKYGSYWSSEEANYYSAYYFNFGGLGESLTQKTFAKHVRAVRDL